MIELRERAVDEIVLVKNIAVTVISILEAVGWSGGIGSGNPALIIDPAEAVETDVFVARIAVGFAGLLDVGQLDAVAIQRLHDGAETEIGVALVVPGGAAAVITQAADPAYRRVQAAVIVELAAIGINHRRHPA